VFACGLALGIGFLAVSEVRRGDPSLAWPPLAHVVIKFVVAPAVLVALSWVEQRTMRAILEAVLFSVAVVALVQFYQQTRQAHFAIDLALTTLLFVALRLAGAWFVRRHLCRVVLLEEWPCCVACDYDLTGNVSGVCPECGAPVEGTATSGGETTTSKTQP